MQGKVERHAGGWAVGATDYDFGGEKLTLNAWHRDQVVEKPGNATVIASNDFCANAALLYDDRVLTVTQLTRRVKEVLEDPARLVLDL